MGKRSQRRSHVQCEKPGCMWSIMSILDFRYGRITQKLLLDRRFESRNRVGSRNQKSMHNTMRNVDENNQVTSDGEDNAEMTRRPSVKDLIEEDLLSEQLSKSETNSAVVELPCFFNSEELMHNGDLGETMDGFCHQKNSSSVKNDRVNGELHHQLSNRSPELEEKLKEILTLFISQRLTERKHHEDNEDDVHHSQELKDALRIVSSDEEFVLKFLQGQRSLLGKYLEWPMNAEVQKDEHMPAGPNVGEQELCENSKQTDELSAAATKRRRLFRKKSKSLDKSSPEGKNSPQTTNRIVILKPGLQNMETKNGHGSSPQSEMTVRNKGGIERSNSQFSFTEIKRRLRNAMGRERHEGSNSGSLKRYPVESGNKSLKESSGRSSPGKAHFFTEKIARHPMSLSKRENAAKPVECEKGKEHQEVCIHSKARESNIYSQAKKHLSDILTNYPKGENYPKTWNSKPLGRILSFPECNSSSSCSFGNDFWSGFIPARLSLPNIEKFQRRESNLGRISLSSELTDDSHSDTKAQGLLDPSSSTLQELASPHSEPTTGIPDEPVHDGAKKSVDELTTEGDKETKSGSEIIASEEINTVDYICEASSYSDTIEDGNADSCEVHEERRGSELCEDHESSPSKECHDLESKELLGRPSPVSVLESVFSEEDISPAARSRSVQPRRIQFEEAESLHSDEDIHLTSATEAAEDCIFDFIKNVLLASGLNWEELHLMSDSLDQILDPSSCYEFEFVPNQLCCDKQLLFDCTDEALMEVYERYFSCSRGLSLGKPPIRPVPDVENTINEVWERVYWHLIPLPWPHTLEQIVRKDMNRDSSWMDLRHDTQTVIVEIGEAIFEDLIQGSILSCVNKSDDDNEGCCVNT